MAKPHRIELSLRDTAAAEPACLVRASTSPDFSEDVRRRSILRRACRSVPVFPPAPVEDHRRVGHHPLSVAHRGNWELHILQPADNCPVDRKSTRLNSSHLVISYAVFCLKKKKRNESGNTEKWS